MAELENFSAKQTAHVLFVYELSDPVKDPVPPDLMAVSRADPVGML